MTELDCGQSLRMESMMKVIVKNILFSSKSVREMIFQSCLTSLKWEARYL